MRAGGGVRPAAATSASASSPSCCSWRTRDAASAAARGRNARPTSPRGTRVSSVVPMID